MDFDNEFSGLYFLQRNIVELVTSFHPYVPYHAELLLGYDIDIYIYKRACYFISSFSFFLITRKGP